ncbi:MAG: GNAT family N-acetyltransferase [Lachnospiraceae bacterium]|nr:GNAT family N-acetyltransferase [Lachnospiraceae bacterium]
MNCYALKPERELLSATAPESIVRMVFDGREDILFLAGFEDISSENGDETKMVSYAVFSHPRGIGRGVWLSYLYTAERYREEGMATKLLSFSEEYLKKKSVTDIMARILTEPEAAGEYHHFFTERGFLPLCLTGRLLVYQYKDMLDPGVFDFLEKKKAQLPPVLHLGDFNRKLLGMIPVELSEEDETFSCFLMAEGRLCGAAVACRAAKRTETEREDADMSGILEYDGYEELPPAETVCIKEIWLDEGARKKGMFLPLFHAVCEEAKTVLSEEMRVQLFIKDEAAYHGLLQMFNPPEQEYLVQEYMKSLVERD